MKKVKFLIIALLLGMSSVASAQSKEVFREILEDFCMSYYEDAFDGKQYIEGTLKVTSVEKDSKTGIYKIMGTHSYRGRYYPIWGRQTHSDRRFKAEAKETGDGLKIKFWKWRDADIQNPKADFEGPCVKTIIP